MSQKFRRFIQLFQYGIKDAEIISQMPDVNLSKSAVFKDIVKCYFKYNIRSLIYRKEEVWRLSPEQREEIGKKSMLREVWEKDFYANHRFLIKWSSFKYEGSAKLQLKRINAYRRRYDIGKHCFIGHDVLFERHHHLNGTLKIGDHVLLAKHTYIDYSGDVIIENGVKIAQGVVIESHHRDIDAYIQGKDINIPTKLHICENAYIGTNAIILDACNYIGKNTRIGAGAVVTKDIPDNAIAAGVPAKILRIVGEEE